MKKYITLYYWAFTVLWKEKTITLTDRFRLWKKSLNLFTCFLAFADDNIPKTQLKGVMISALLSAIYDYETDWVRVSDLDQSIYLRLLKQTAFDSSSYEEAQTLFISDWRGELSEHGLERGSSALIFYHSLIKSSWMNVYSLEELARNGRLLQIIDDLLDLAEDKKNGHTNCFLTEQSHEQYLFEAKTFLLSDFFKALQKGCVVYYLLEFECLRVLNQQQNIYPNRRETLRLLRPLTGVYACICTLIGFRFFPFPWFTALLTSLTIAGITYSTMVWNDLIDRERDLQKKKVLAFHHPYLVYTLWLKINKPTLLLLIVVVFFSWPLGLFCLTVWILSISYSILKLKYPYNNLLVAFCSASPVLAGMIYNLTFDPKAWYIFLITFSTITVMEHVKDIQDMEGDIGYKHTLAVHYGKNLAIKTTMFLCGFPMVGLILYPDKILLLGILFFIPILWNLYRTSQHTRAIYWVESWGDIFVASVLITILFIQ